MPQYAILYSSIPSPTGGAPPAPLPALTPDSMVELDFDADSDLPSHPIEEGQFASYNRVQEAIPIRLLLACQGVNMGRAAFLSALEGLRQGTDLVTLVTPDASYPNMALKGYGYKKTAEQGAVTIWADTRWLEIRSTGVSVSAPASSQPQGMPTVNIGATQLQPLTASQLASVGNPSVPPVALPADVASEAPPSGDAF